jgi:SAM-dependent methyltransferase
LNTKQIKGEIIKVSYREDIKSGYYKTVIEMRQLNEKEAFELLVARAERARFSGWNFEYITRTVREVDGALPWSYNTEVLKLMGQSKSMLDMGTGGGELLSLMAPLPPKACATEGYKPNLALAKKRPAPLGVKVYGITGDAKLPFRDEEFDLVINKHEGYIASEIFRILKPGGMFITQQVGAYYVTKINELLGARVKHSNRYLKNAVNALEGAGLGILAKKEAYPTNRFFDIGAVVYYLNAIPWQLPGFSVKRYRNKLFELHKLITKKGYIDFRAHNYFIVARKGSTSDFTPQKNVP